MSIVRCMACMCLVLWLFNLGQASDQKKEKMPEKPWTGKLADGRVINEADLAPALT